MSRARVPLAGLGALIYAGAGLLMGAMNAGWFGLERGANPILGVLGVGAALVVLAFRGSRFHRQVRATGMLGLVTIVLLVAGPAMYVLSWLVGFAILGTLTLGLGLICLTVSVWRARIGDQLDRVLVTLSAIGSWSWNTETTSAFILVAVGLLWLVLSVRLLARPAA